MIILLTDKQVKDTIKKNKIRHREFYLGNNKATYGLINNNKVEAMLTYSQNSQLLNSVKIYTPFGSDEGVKLLLGAVIKGNKGNIIYCDILEGYKGIFEGVGFTFTSVRDKLKMYNELWRGIYSANSL